MNDQTTSPGTDLGYWLDIPDRATLALHHQLWVWMRAQPTERHYDPERVECNVVTPGDTIGTITLHHPWPRATHYRFCLGGINLNDRKHRLVHFYAFGGELTIEAADARATLCRFTSPAPILALDEQNALTSVFVAEVQAEIAEARAMWDVEHHQGDFSTRLSQADPLALYRVFLRAAAANLRPIQADITVPEHQLVHFAERELAAFAHVNGDSDDPLTLTELLMTKITG